MDSKKNSRVWDLAKAVGESRSKSSVAFQGMRDRQVLALDALGYSFSNESKPQ